jgi:hypothetical protein
MSNLCPKCSKDDQVQKVSAIYSNGIIRGETSTAQTNLSKTLAPPTRPPIKSNSNAFVWIFLVVVACSALSLTWGEEIANYVAGAVFFLALFGLFGYFSRIVKKSKEEDDRASLLWQNTVLKNWNELYYCYRDDCVFDPNSRKSVPPHNMNQLLF